MKSAGRRPGDARAPHGIDTLAIHAGQAPDPAYGAVAPPIYQTSSFVFASPEQGAARFAGTDPGYIYSRIDNPTTRQLEDCLAALEGGVGALATSSGMAACATVFFALLRSGDHVVGTDTVYGPTRLLLEKDFSRFGVASSFVDSADLGRIEAAIRPETRLLFIETPANPTLKLTDIAACARLASARKLALVVDNTFASPVLQRPLALGADVVLHSTTKYLNGHSDGVGGIITAREAEVLASIRRMRTYLGGTMDPHQAWLVLRGMKTLALRVRAAQENAKRLAPVLEAHPAVARVFYPGLASHPQHALGTRQMGGPGSMIAFELKGGRAAGTALMKSFELMTLAVSLGGVETLVEHPASMTHAGLGPRDLAEAGITEGLVRLAVGCESVEDLEADLVQALDRL